MRSESYYNAQHRKRIDQFARKVFDVYRKAANTAIAMAMSVEYDQNKPFSFGDYPGLKTRVNNMLSDLYSGLINTINAGTSAEWDWSNQKNDDLVKSLFGENMPKALEDRFLGRNMDALKAFQGRKTDGLDLSGRIWNYTQQFKGELEMALDVGLTDGRSASQLSQDVRGYLNDPDKLFRRVRDKRGVLQLSTAAKNYNPGQGVYRSSYKNAMRLTRTEINMAYREADHTRFQDLDFVVGFQVHRSNNPYACDVCESLKGKYPKTFKFVGWHPQCRCYVTSILATREEMDQLTDMILNGEDTAGFKSVNQVEYMPGGYEKWIDKNNERLLRAKSTPYFIRDNYKSANLSKGLRIGIRPSEYSQADVTKLFSDPEAQASLATVKHHKLGEKFGLTPEEAASIYHYTGDSYWHLNYSLREKNVDEFHKAFGNVINGALSKIPRFNGVTYRGLSMEAKDLQRYRSALDSKSLIVEESFLSTSADAKLASAFNGNDPRVFIEISGKNGRYIDDLSSHGKNFQKYGEEEVLFKSGSRFRVTKIDDSGDVLMMYLDEVD